MKMKGLRLLFIMGICALVTACASASGEIFSSGPQLTQGQTGIYFYRGNYKLENRAANFDIYVDNQKVGLLRNAGYLYAVVSPGEHTLQVVNQKMFLDNGTKISMSINPGQIIYYRVGMNWDSTIYLSGTYLPSGHVAFEPISRDVALKQLESLRYSS